MQTQNADTYTFTHITDPQASDLYGSTYTSPYSPVYDALKGTEPSHTSTSVAGLLC